MTGTAPRDPLFSIVIPTRRRAHLLPHALRSALEQTFDDYEIVVVANDCQDGTRDVVANMADRRVRYYETDRLLTMPENWEFSWTKARGKYVTYLCDDDALVPTALQTVAEHGLSDVLPAVISWEDAPYYYPDWHDPRMQNLMLLFFHGERLVEDVPAERYRLECARFGFEWSSPLPKLLNCFARRDHFESWRKRLGKLFFATAPDYSFAWISSHVCDEIRVIHRPLTVRGISDHSIGSNAGLGQAGQEFLEEFGRLDLFEGGLVRIPASFNHIATTFGRVSVALRAQGVTPEPIDTERFLLGVARQLTESRDLLGDWAAHAAELTAAAGLVAPDLRHRVQVVLSAAAPEVGLSETIRALRDRTAVMAEPHEASVQRVAAMYGGDEGCARCTLGLEPGVLADSEWGYLYVFGDDVGAFDPYAISTHVDQHYARLADCRRRRHAQPDLST